MKIICIGRNYKDHAKEMAQPVPDVPMFFLKPDSALLPKRNPFFIPNFSDEIHYEVELIYKEDVQVEINSGNLSDITQGYEYYQEIINY